MTDDAYSKKIGDLQKHVPFLENMISQLKDPKGKPREAQLNKLEAVHNMITDRNKKWKFETLLKCEEVITKLQTKVKANRSSFVEADRTASVSQTVSQIMNALKFNNARAKLNSEVITPKSPSPVREPPVKHAPKIIPTEKPKVTANIDPDDFNIGTWTDDLTEERYVNEKPDIYNSAAKSLISPPQSSSVNKSTIFDRLGPVVPDVTKPLLSDADLASLSEDFAVVKTDETKSNEKTTPSKTAPRIVPIPTSKPKSTPKVDEKKPVGGNNRVVPKVEKLKDCDMFGNLLSSIDTKIIEGSKKKDKKKDDKKERKRNSTEKNETTIKVEDNVEIKVVATEKPIRLADKYHPKPKKHIESDLGKTLDETIQKRMESDPQISLKIDIFTNTKEKIVENRDPRRRLSIIQDSPPPPQQQTHIPTFIPPSQNRGSLLDLPSTRLPSDPRRPQPRFSPPPQVLNTFHPSQQNYPNPNPNYGPPPGFVRQQQQQHFNNQQQTFHGGFFGAVQTFQNPSSLRYEQNSTNVRFEPPNFTNAGPFTNVPQKKSFNPFEPLDAEKETLAPDFFPFNKQAAQQPADSNFQRGRGAQFRGGTNYNQYNRQDRSRPDYSRRPNFQQSVKVEKPVPKYNKDVSRTKYDEMYAKLEKDKETFTSPLECLYSDPKSSIKTTIQSFKIPKKTKIEDPPPPSPIETPKPEIKVEQQPKALPIEEIKEVKKIKPEKKKEKPPRPPPSPSPSPPPPPIDDSDSSDSDVPLKMVRRRVSGRSAMIAARKKILDDDSDEEEARPKSRKAKTAAKKKLAESSAAAEVEETTKKIDEIDDVKLKIETPKTEDVETKTETENVEVKTKAEDKTKVEMQEEKEEAATKSEEKKVEVEKKPKIKTDVDKAKELLTETKAGGLDIDDKELLEFVLQNFKKIRQLFKKDSSSDEEDEVATKKENQKEDVDVAATNAVPVEEKKEEEEPVVPVVVKKPAAAIKKKRGPKPKVKKAPPAKKMTQKVEGRITRTRSAILLSAPKRPRRSELDKLHEDIKEMLMGGEVLTASCKRACTLQKDEQDDPSSTKAGGGGDDENIFLSTLVDSSKVDPKKLKAKGANLRVLLEKTDLAKLLIKDELKKSKEIETQEEEPEPEQEAALEPQIIFDKSSSPKQKMLKKKRRRFNWASGVIKKKKKAAAAALIKSSQEDLLEDETPTSPPSDDESGSEETFELSSESNNELLYVEPDREYFPNESKPQCKLCPFKGKFIVQHYKSVHLEHEVLISRMNPKFSQEAILESVQKNLDAVEATESSEDQKLRRKRFNYGCPFCPVKFAGESSETFYDHLASHTGEYRFSCPYCSFKTSTSKNMRPHIMTSHNRSSENVVKASWPGPPNFRYVFGYICSECHYVQLNRNTVEDHVKIYHLDNQKIYKINMSSAAPLCEKEVADDESEAAAKDIDVGVDEVETKSSSNHIDEAIESVVKNYSDPIAEVTKSTPPKRKAKPAAQVKQLKMFELINEITEADKILTEISAIAADESVPTIKTEPPEEEEELEPPRPKSPDLTVFMGGNPDLVVEEASIEEKRLKKMNEIHEIVKPSRTSIVDKLQSRLETTDSVVAAAVPVDLEVPPPPLVPIEKVPTKVVEAPKEVAAAAAAEAPKEVTAAVEAPKEVVVPSPEQALPEKKKAAPIISNIINRLQDKLVCDTTNKQLPPLIHYRELKTDDRPGCSLRIGPVQVMLSKNGVLYACFVPTCVFCTDKQNIFETHCKVTHRNYHHLFSESHKCDVCHVKIDHDGDYVTMHDTFVHLITGHEDFLKKLATLDDAAVTSDGNKAEENKMAAQNVKILDDFKLPHEVPNLISQGDDENTGAKYPFVITSVTSLAPQKKQPPSPEKSVAKQQRLDLIRPVPFAKLCASPETSSPSTPPKKQPMVRNKIVVVSPPLLLNHLIGNPQTTTGNVLPVLPTVGSPQKKQIVLRDIPLKGAEKNQDRKTAAALAALLTLKKNRQLFKCPDFYCTFSTDSSVELTRHLASHAYKDLALLPCLYCDYKVSCETYAIHVEVKHGHCAYGCEYCMYRATCWYFVSVHHQLKHSNLQPKAIAIPIFPSNVKAISSDATAPLRKTILPYACGSLDCGYKTYFTEDYLNHVTTSHDGKLHCGSCVYEASTPNIMLTHWTSHRVFPFQCRYCLFGAKVMSDIGKHEAILHFTCECSIICRIFVPTPTHKKPSDYSIDDDEIFDRLLKLPKDSHTAEGKLLLKINKNQTKSILLSNEIPNVVEKKEEISSPPPDVKKPANEIEVIQIIEDENIARNETTTSDEQRNYEEPVILTDGNLENDDVDPLSLDSVFESLQTEMDPCGNLFDESIDEYVEEENAGHEELSGKDLFKCKCGVSYESSVPLRSHIVQCQKEKPFGCAHCIRTFKTITGLLHHYRDHGRARFKCSLCQFKRRHQVAVRNHMKAIHNVANVMLLPVIAKKIDIDNDDFVLRPKQGVRKSTDSTSGPPKPPVEDVPVVETKSVFGADEIDLLPRQPIYQTDVRCATCSYATKVKSNMVRHLQFHQTEQDVPIIAPVNPVPCLEKSERMFDKMVNLASSSHVGGRMGGVKGEKVVSSSEVEFVVPAFVPVTNRYVCGAENCNYLCPEEAMLRRHLTAFHSDDGVYTCLHCKAKISEEKSLNIESVLKHLRLHDHNLYQCGHCKMIHNLKHKMERHISDKHFEKPPNVIVLREKEKEPEIDSAAVPSEASKEPKSWRCGMCKYRCVTFNEIKSHACNKHYVESKYKCALCSYKGEVPDSFPEHFEKKHPGHEPDMIVCYFKDDELVAQKPEGDSPEFNTTPLWQRNKHVKHIRGILLEESAAANKTPQGPKKLKSSPKAKKDEPEGVVVVAGKLATVPRLSPAKKSSISVVETSLRGSKTFKIVKRALKTTKGGKVIKVAGYKIGNSTAHIANKPVSEVIDITSCDDAATAPPLPDSSDMYGNLEFDDLITFNNKSDSTTSSTTSSSIKLVNIQTLLEDPTSSDSSGFINIANAIAKETDTTTSDVETIEIIDDDESGGSGKKRKVDLMFKEINKMSKDELVNGNYVGTYGPYGVPWDRKYKCPLCEKMTCRTEKEFTVHLYQELQYGAYKCNLCGMTDLAEDIVQKHYVDEHGVLNSSDIVQMGWDRQIEEWIYKVIAFQTRILKLEKKADKKTLATSSEKTCVISNMLSKIEEEEDDKTKTLYCTFCNYRCKYSSDRRKHELRHWSSKPYSCGYCSYEALHRSAILKHMVRIHKHQKLLINEKDMGNGVIIKPIKTMKKLVSLSVSEEQSEDSEDVRAATVANPKGDYVKCFYCDYTAVFDDQKSHNRSSHPNLPLRVYRYKCNYCEKVFMTLVTLNEHFFETHPGLEHSSTSVECQPDNKYRCPKCFYGSDNYSNVKYHVRSHFKPFECLYCCVGFSYWNQIHKHHYESHPSSVYEYRYVLNIEKESWSLMEEIQVKKGSSYEVALEAKSRKRKMFVKDTTTTAAAASNSNDDDDDVLIIEDNDVPAKKIKMTARKSTGPHKRHTEGYSYYGSKPNDNDLNVIITTVEIMGASVTMYVEQLSKIFNLFPTVLVEDCGDRQL